MQIVGKQIAINSWCISGTKEMFSNQDKKSITVTPIGTMRENGTDLIFFLIDNKLHYTYPTCITAV